MVNINSPFRGLGGRAFLLILLLLSSVCHAQEATDTVRHEVLFETSKGNIRFVLYNETPKHRDAMLKHVSEGFYDGVLFHRVIKNFMIQAGDPDSKRAQPGMQIGEGSDKNMDVIPAEIVYPKYRHKRGALAAARQGDAKNPNYDSSNSQFYFVYGRRSSEDEMYDAYFRNEKVFSKLPEDVWENIKMYYMRNPGTPWLDGTYTVFGEILEGLEVVEAIQAMPTDKNSRPTEDVAIIKATVLK